MLRSGLSVLAALAVSLAPVEASAQLDAPARAAIIDAALALLDANYVFPEVGTAMVEHVRARARNGDYDAIDDVEDFARTLTDDLRSVSRDLHLAVFTRRPPVAAASSSAPAQPRGPFVRASVLEGNLGYVAISRFVGPDQLHDDLASAMNEVAETDALLIDLRDNGGGSPASVMLLAGYLIPERTLVARIYSRPTDSSTEMWTTPVAGPHYGRDVFILTNGNTFSAAEAAAYHLKHLGRARTVGEASGGGAHRIDRATLPHGLAITVPFTRPINVVTDADWEGTGTLPDIPAPSAQALVAAQLAALHALPPTPEREALIRKLSG